MDDPERAKRFYAAVTGREFGDTGTFPDDHLFMTGERSGGGIGRFAVVRDTEGTEVGPWEGPPEA